MNTPGRVLLVEDEEVLYTTLGELIRRRGHTCAIATSIEAGLALLHEPFDAIVTDIHLPDGNYLEMLASIDRIDCAPPVIVITGFPSLENAIHAIDRHAFAYRIKPFDFNELLDLVDSAVVHGRLRQQIDVSTKRARELARDLGQLRNPRLRAPRTGIDQTVQDYLLLLLGNNIASLNEVIDILQSMDCAEGQRPIRALSQDPEAAMFRSAVEHTVKVLEATRRSFKSRELADLRRQLEGALAAAEIPAGKPADPGTDA